MEAGELAETSTGHRAQYLIHIFRNFGEGAL